MEPNSNLAELLTIFLALGFECRQTKGMRRRSSPSYQSMSLILQHIRVDGLCAVDSPCAVLFSDLFSAITIVGLIVEGGKRQLIKETAVRLYFYREKFEPSEKKNQRERTRKRGEAQRFCKACL